VAGRAERQAAAQAATEFARKAANYQAWYVMNTAQGKGGSGGRIDALRDLKTNGVSLAGVNLDGAWLENVELDGAALRFATLVGANLRGASLELADLHQADLTSANLVGARMSGAFLKGADLTGAQFSTADLRNADLADVRGWQEIKGISYANIDGIRNAPAGFREWALERGANDGTEPEGVTPEQTFSTSWRTV